jgi:hypothetical protein
LQVKCAWLCHRRHEQVCSQARACLGQHHGHGAQDAIDLQAWLQAGLKACSSGTNISCQMLGAKQSDSASRSGPGQLVIFSCPVRLSSVALPAVTPPGVWWPGADSGSVTDSEPVGQCWTPDVQQQFNELRSSWSCQQCNAGRLEVAVTSNERVAVSNVHTAWLHAREPAGNLHIVTLNHRVWL